MTSRDKAQQDRQIKIVREDDGWSIKISDTNPETRNRPLTKEERNFVREEVKRGAVADSG
jgi:hypothetical protein